MLHLQGGSAVRVPQECQPRTPEELERQFAAVSPELHPLSSIRLSAIARCLQPGQRLAGRYVIETELGEGGFGMAYAAFDEQLAERRVVIKVLRDHHIGLALADTHFRREMEALAHLDHPGIVSVYDSGELPGGWFLVMQFVPGKTLRAALDHGPFYPARAIKLVRQLAAAIDFAHGASICHHDLKPENIVLRDAGTPTERAVLIDFGLAVAAGQPSPAAGSMRYMAPERRTGRGGPASDLYALGVVALEMLARSALLPHSLTRLPLAVQAVLARVTDTDMTARFASASEFAEALAVSLRPHSGMWRYWAVAAAVVLMLMAGLR